jgi:hypothetical protein
MDHLFQNRALAIYTLCAAIALIFTTGTSRKIDELNLRGAGLNDYDGDCEPIVDGWPSNGLTHCDATPGANRSEGCDPSEIGIVAVDCDGMVGYHCTTSIVWDSCVMGAPLPTASCPDGVMVQCLESSFGGFQPTWKLLAGQSRPGACGTYPRCPSIWSF